MFSRILLIFFMPQHIFKRLFLYSFQYGVHVVVNQLDQFLLREKFRFQIHLFQGNSRKYKNLQEQINTIIQTFPV